MCYKLKHNEGIDSRFSEHLVKDIFAMLPSYFVKYNGVLNYEQFLN